MSNISMSQSPHEPTWFKHERFDQASNGYYYTINLKGRKEKLITVFFRAGQMEDPLTERINHLIALKTMRQIYRNQIPESRESLFSAGTRITLIRGRTAEGDKATLIAKKPSSSVSSYFKKNDRKHKIFYEPADYPENALSSKDLLNNKDAYSLDLGKKKHRPDIDNDDSISESDEIPTYTLLQKYSAIAERLLHDIPASYADEASDDESSSDDFTEIQSRQNQPEAPLPMINTGQNRTFSPPPETRSELDDDSSSSESETEPAPRKVLEEPVLDQPMDGEPLDDDFTSISVAKDSPDEKLATLKRLKKKYPKRKEKYDQAHTRTSYFQSFISTDKSQMRSNTEEKLWECVRQIRELANMPFSRELELKEEEMAELDIEISHLEEQITPPLVLAAAPPPSQTEDTAQRLEESLPPVLLDAIILPSALPAPSTQPLAPPPLPIHDRPDPTPPSQVTPVVKGRIVPNQEGNGKRKKRPIYVGDYSPDKTDKGKHISG